MKECSECSENQEHAKKLSDIFVWKFVKVHTNSLKNYVSIAYMYIY